MAQPQVLKMIEEAKKGSVKYGSEKPVTDIPAMFIESLGVTEGISPSDMYVTADIVGSLADLHTTSKNSIVSAVNEVKQSGDSWKTDIATAITAKGVDTVASDTREVFVANISSISSGGTPITGSIEISGVIGEDVEKGDLLGLSEYIAHDNPLPYTPGTNIGSINWCDITTDEQYIAIGGGVHPILGHSIHIYKLVNGKYEHLQDAMPSAIGKSVSCITFSNDNNFLVACLSSSPYLAIYKRNGDSFIACENPTTLPTGMARECVFSPDDSHLVVSFVGSPGMAIYKKSGDTFTKLGNPSDTPTYSKGLAYSPNGKYLVAGHNQDINMSIYKVNGDTYTKLEGPLVGPPSDAHYLFSPDSRYLFCAHTGNPRMTAYRIISDVFTPIEVPTDLIGKGRLGTSGLYSICMNPRGDRIIVTHAGSPFVKIFNFIDGIFESTNLGIDHSPNVYPHAITKYKTERGFISAFHGTFWYNELSNKWLKHKGMPDKIGIANESATKGSTISITQINIDKFGGMIP